MRRAGVLLHPTSLPGGAIGEIGAEAYRFVDWLVEAGQSDWQILPLVAVDSGGSPYNGLSALAGNPFLVDLEALVGKGLLTREEAAAPEGDPECVDFAAVAVWKDEALRIAHRALCSGRAPELAGELERYRREQAHWLEDYALFRALRDAHGGAAWTAWEPALRDREPEAMERARRDHAVEVDRRAFEQLLFDRQWRRLRRHANEQGIRIVGDLPIFVAHDSADVWAHRDLFLLDERGEPEVVAGVPPDYFSATGQRWGNPLYRWSAMRAEGYPWWAERFRRTLHWVDVVRVDHFRGFEAYWAIPADADTAVGGEWREGPGAEFFRSLAERLGPLPVIAEDLGLITPAVEALRDELGFPGMRVLQFAFDGDPANPHLPANYPERCVAYTGTHDNDTAVGWWESAPPEVRARARAVLGGGEEPVQWAMIRAVLYSAAELAIVPVQDVLGLGAAARMNTPGTTEGNWSWRLRDGQLRQAHAEMLREHAFRAGRLAPRAAMGGATATGEGER